MLLRYCIDDVSRGNDGAYVILKFNFFKNLLIIGGLLKNIEFVQGIVNLIEPSNEAEPYCPQKHVVRFNLGMNLPTLLKAIDKLKQSDCLDITKIKKINRLI